MHIINIIMTTYFIEFPNPKKILPKPIEQMSQEEYLRYQTLPSRIEIVEYATLSCSIFLNFR